MKTKILLLLSLILSGLVILSACASETPSEEPIEPPAPEANPVAEEPLEPADPSYPAPELGVQPDEAYPAPQELAANDPYPGVEVVGSASDWDLSTAMGPDDFSVQSSDENLKTGPVFIGYHEIIQKESDPVEVVLVVVGNLPTPCHQLRVVSAEPDEAGFIEINAHTVVDPDQMCTQVLEPFTAVIPLGEFTEGTFTYLINRELNGKFKLP